MIIIKVAVGFLFTLSGAFILLHTGFAWHELVGSAHSAPLKDYLTLFLGLAFFALGSWIIVKTFKTNPRQGDTIFKKNPWIAALVFVLILAQSCLVLFQIHELARYKEQVEPYMPTMTSAGDKTVTEPFYRWTVEIPFWAQLVLLSVVGIMLLCIAKNKRGNVFAFLISAWIACFSWCCSLAAMIFAVGTYD